MLLRLNMKLWHYNFVIRKWVIAPNINMYFYFFISALWQHWQPTLTKYFPNILIRSFKSVQQKWHDLCCGQLCNFASLEVCLSFSKETCIISASCLCDYQTTFVMTNHFRLFWIPHNSFSVNWPWHISSMGALRNITRLILAVNKYRFVA